MSRPEGAGYWVSDDGVVRGRLTDNSRDGSKICRKEDVCFEMNFASTTIEETAYDDGWDRIQRPVGGDPRPANTSGMAGEGGDYDLAATESQF